MKKYSKAKVQWEVWDGFMFCHSLMHCLIEDHWSFITAFAFSLLWYVALFEIYEETPFIHRYIVEKRWGILASFACNCVCSLIYRDSANGRFFFFSLCLFFFRKVFLRVSCVESEHCQWIFCATPSWKNLLVHLALWTDLWPACDCYNIVHWSLKK